MEQRAWSALTEYGFAQPIRNMMHRWGARAAASVAGIGVLYIAVLLAGVARHGTTEPIGDPILAIMEVLTLLSAAAVLVALVALYLDALPDRRFYALVALAFGVLFAGTTSAVHFVELSAGRQSGATRMVWPSDLYAAELLAWDWFLGLALLAAAGAFAAREQLRLRLWFLIAGVPTLIGGIGPLLGDMRIQRIGILGYAILVPIAFLQLARHFRRRAREHEEMAIKTFEADASA